MAENKFKNYDDLDNTEKDIEQISKNGLIKIMSYNIWFSEFFRIERMISLVENINHYNPDIICMQEVISTVYDKLIFHLVHYKYHYPKDVNNSYNCVIFSKYPIIECENVLYNNTFMGRSLLTTVIRILLENNEYRNIVVATSHFESVFNKVNPIKIEQFYKAKAVLEKMHKKYESVILCADTNLIMA